MTATPYNVPPKAFKVDSDSPFGECFNGWMHARKANRFSGPAFLAQFDSSALDENASVARMKLNTPIYAGDVRLSQFVEDCETVIIGRF